MKKIKLITSTLLVSILSILAGFSVANDSESKQVKADKEGTITTVYYAVPSDVVGTYTVKLNVKLAEYDNWWEQYDMERDGYKTQDGKLLYKCEYQDAYNGVHVMQFQLYNGSSQVSQQEPISYHWTPVSEYNGKVYVHNTGWAEYNPEETYYTVSRYKVLTEYGSSRKDGPYLIDELTVPAGYELDCTKGVYVYDREWRGWHYNPSITESTPSTLTITSDISIYGEYFLVQHYPSYYQVDLNNSGWADGEADYAIMSFNDSLYDPVAFEWSEYIENVPAGQRYVRIFYQTHFDAYSITIVRYNKDNTREQWERDRWANVWNQTVDAEIDMELTARISDQKENNKNLVYGGSPFVMCYTTDGLIGYDDMREGKSNGSNNTEYYGVIEFDTAYKFKIGVPPLNEQYDLYANYTADSSVAGDFYYGEDGYIHLRQAGSYSFYFDTYTHNLYITGEGSADAEIWAQYFLDEVGCDASGVNLPTGWSDSAERYRSLCNSAKDIVYGSRADQYGTLIEQAVARYEVAVRSHPSLTKFIKDSGGKVRPVASRVFVPISIDTITNSGTSIIIVVSIITASAILGYFLLRKRKED